MNITPRLGRLAAVVLVTLLMSAATSTWAQTLEWVRPVGTGNSDRANAVTVDTAGNVYVGGSTSGTFAGQDSAGSADAFVAKSDASGDMVWVRQFGTSGSDGVASADTDAAGFLYAAGFAGANALLAKYDSTGSQQWVRQFGVAGYGTARVTGVAADGAGNTYLLGAVLDPIVPPPVTGPRWFLTKYDADGAREWFQMLESATLIPNSYNDIATDDVGHVYIVGYSHAPSPSSFDHAILVEFDQAGNRVVGGSGGGVVPVEGHSYFYQVAADPLGNIYVAGQSVVPRLGSRSYFLARYDVARNFVWEQPLSGAAADLAADARGSYVAIGSSLAMHDLSGSQLWETSVVDRIASVAVTNSGDIYLAVNASAAAYLTKVTSPQTPVGNYEIVSRNSEKCLDVYGASTDAAAPVIQWVCHGGENQQWAIEPAGDGAFRITARHSGQVLDVYGALLDDATPTIQYPWLGGDNQRWAIEPTSDGYVRIVARHSGKVLDVEGASVDDGARVIQYTPHGGANQQWLLRPVSSTGATTVSAREP